MKYVISAWEGITCNECNSKHDVKAMYIGNNEIHLCLKCRNDLIELLKGGNNMERKTGILGYNYDEKRIGILNSMDLWADSGLHCGECFEVLINDEWVADRIEYRSSNQEWYLVYSGLKGEQLEGVKVRY